MIDKLANRFHHLNTLIRKRATGTPKELAERLGITERAWYKIRDELIHDLNVPLAYDPQRQTYYYTEAGQFVFGFCRSLTTSDMEELEGGGSIQVQPDRVAFGLSYALNW